MESQGEDWQCIEPSFGLARACSKDTGMGGLVNITSKEGVKLVLNIGQVPNFWLLLLVGKGLSAGKSILPSSECPILDYVCRGQPKAWVLHQSKQQGHCIARTLMFNPRWQQLLGLPKGSTDATQLLPQRVLRAEAKGRNWRASQSPDSCWRGKQMDKCY